MRAIGIATSIAAVTFFSWIWSGYATSVLWGWFIVPVFGLDPLSIPAAIGISMVVSFLAKDVPDHEEGKPFADVMAEAVGVAIARPLFTLISGFVVSLFM